MRKREERGYSQVFVLSNKGDSMNICWDEENWRVRNLDQKSHLSYIKFEMPIKS